MFNVSLLLSTANIPKQRFETISRVEHPVAHAQLASINSRGLQASEGVCRKASHNFLSQTETGRRRTVRQAGMIQS